MSKEKIVKVVHVRLNPEEARVFDAVASHLGLRNDAEVLRYLIMQFYNEHKAEIAPTPLYEHFNIDFEKGVVRVLDRKQRIIADVYFRRRETGPVVICEWDRSSSCEHVKYALTVPEIKEALYKNGWIVTENFELKRR